MMFKAKIAPVLLALAAAAAAPAGAQDKAFALAVAPALEQSGLLRYVLPRFALKTGIRPSLAPLETPGAVTGQDAVLGPHPEITVDGATVTAQRVFDALADGTVYYIAATRLPGPGAEHAEAFVDWLRSEAGQNTVAAFAVDGAPAYAASAGVVPEAAPMVFEGDVVLGAKLAETHCGRCHVVDPAKRFGGLGSTPSFGALKALSDWEHRFQAFFALNPHPSFTQIEDVTPAFDPTLPPPIVPVRLTQDEMDDILAFVAGMEAADLGAPVEAR